MLVVDDPDAGTRLIKTADIALYRGKGARPKQGRDRSALTPARLEVRGPLRGGWVGAESPPLPPTAFTPRHRPMPAAARVQVGVLSRVDTKGCRFAPRFGHGTSIGASQVGRTGAFRETRSARHAVSVSRTPGGLVNSYTSRPHRGRARMSRPARGR